MALGDILYRASLVWKRLGGNTTTTKKFLSQTGTGVISAIPAWDTVGGSSISGFTSGSVIFANTDGSLTEDNTNLFWNKTTFQLKVFSGGASTASVGIGTDSLVAIDTALVVRRVNPPDIGYVAKFLSNLTSYIQIKSGTGANEQAGFSLFQTTNGFEWRVAVIGNDGNALRFGAGTGGTDVKAYITQNGNFCINDSNIDPATGTKCLMFGDGTAPATLDSNTAGLYADDVAGTVNMFAINEAGNTSKLTGFTTGSVIFATTATGFTEDNSNLFWDNTNKRLGIGTTTPSVPLHISGGVMQIDVYGSATSGFVGRSAGGTFGTPSQTNAGTVISSFTGRAYTDAGAFTSNIGAINIVTVVAPTAADQETTISLRVVPSGSTTNTTIFECYGNAAVVSIGFLSFNNRAATSVALKRSTTVLQTRLADDSAFAQHSALEFMNNRANFLMRTAVAWTNGAAANAGTLGNAPAAGNPTKWIPVDDNGTTRYIPAW